MSRPSGRWLTVLAVLFLLVTQLAAPVAASNHGDNGDGASGEDRPDEDDNPGRDNGTEDGDGANSTQDDGTAGESDDDPEDRGRGPPAGIGHFQQQGDAFDGRFIAVEATDRGLANLSYEGTALFDAIGVDGLAVEEARTHGARIEVEGESAGKDVELRVHDTPTALMRLDIGEGVQLDLALADGVTPSMDGDRRVNLVASDVQAVLWVEDATVALDGSTLTVTGEARVNFMVSRGPTTSEEASRVGSEVARATSEGKVGAEIRAVAERGRVRSEVVTFGDMSVMAAPGNNSLMIVVSSDNETGRTVVVHLDPAVLGTNASDELEVRFDGRPIGQAEDLQDVLDPSDDGRAEFVLVHGSDGIQALVSIPSFSTRTVEIAALPGSQVLAQVGLSPAQAMAALAAAGATVLVAAAVAGKRT